MAYTLSVTAYTLLYGTGVWKSQIERCSGSGTGARPPPGGESTKHGSRPPTHEANAGEADADGSGEITINEIITAVNKALNGCG